MTDDRKHLCEETAYFMRRLYERGLTTTSGGNISVRYGENVLITPSATDKGRMAAGQIGELDLAGRVIGGEFKPTIETRMHLEIYQRRSEVRAVVHAHPVVAGALAASRRKISTAYLAEAYVILGEPAYADYRLQGTVELAGIVGDAVEKSDCIVMRNHGIITVGNSLLEAFDRLEVLENAARTTILCESVLAGDAEKLDAAQLAELSACFRR